MGRREKLKQTKTYEANDEVLPAYLLDMKRAGDNVVLLLWNEVPSTDQSVPSVQEDTEFGTDPTVILNSIQKGSIPRFCYLLLVYSIHGFSG